MTQIAPLSATSIKQGPSDRKIRLLIELFRHGARREQEQTPFPKLPLMTPKGVDPSLGYGDLTFVGMRQHYLLGKQIRKAYQDFLPSDFDYKNVRISASSYNRTVISAEAQLLGLFDLGAGKPILYDNKTFYQPPIKDFSIDFNGTDALPNLWQPLPVANPSTEKNFIFSAGGPACPTLHKNLEVNKKAFSEKYTDDFKPLYSTLIANGFDPQTFINKPTYSLNDALTVCDYIVSNNWSDADFKIPQDLIDQCLTGMALSDFDYFFTVDPLKTLVTAVNQVVIDELNNYRKSDKHDLELVMLSGHDTTLSIFLLNFFPGNAQCILKAYKNGIYGAKGDPGYTGINPDSNCIDRINFTANVFIEFYTVGDSADLFVSLKYNNVELEIGKPGEDLKLDDFVAMLQRNIDTDFNSNCGAPDLLAKEGISTLMMISLVASVLIIVLMVIVFILISKKEKKALPADRNAIYESLMA